MEDQNGAPSESVATAPFSELISAWLDEGDRLDEKAIATTAAAPPVIETRARRILTLLRPALDRYRVVVLAAVGLVPFALFALTHRSASVVPVAAAATVAPRSASPLARPADAPTPALAPTRPPEVAGICEGAAAAPTVLELRSADPRPALPPHHHHHRHHLAKQPGLIAKQPVPCGRGPCAVTRPVPPSAHAAVASPSARAAVVPPSAHAAVAGPARSAPVSTRIQPRR
jgi:hypothetical protein